MWRKRSPYLGVLSLVSLLGLFFLLPATANATTGINQELSFEGKIVTTAGINITDGTYNMEFKIYSGGSSTGGGTLLWTEDWLVGSTEGGITFSSGTYQVNLGATCPFTGGSCETNTNTAINWNSYPLYLSLQIGNTSSCTITAGTTFQSDCGGDGEMTPYILLTSTPYSFNSGELGGLLAPTAAPSTGECLQTSSTVASQLVLGSCGSGGGTESLQQAYNASTGGTSPDILLNSTVGTLTVQDASTTIGTNLFSVNASASTGLGTSLFSVGNGGSVTQKTVTNSTSALSIQNAAGDQVLGVDTTNQRVVVGYPSQEGTPAGQLYVGGGLVSQATVTTGTNPRTIYVSGEYAYVINYGSNTMQIFNITNPNNVTSVSTTTTDSGPWSVYVSGNYAYVVDYTSSNLQVFDVSNPANPVVIGSVTTGTSPDSVYVQGRYAYLANEGSSTIQVFDVSNPANPVLIGSAATEANPFSLYVEGIYAYVVDYNSNVLQIFNIADPANPVSASVANTGSNPRAVYVSGEYAYVVDASDNTLYVYNVSNPYSPSLVSPVVTTGSGPRDIYIQGRYAYVVNYAGTSLQVFDVSNPASPVLINTITTSGDPFNIDVSGRYAYVVNFSSNNFQIFNLGGTYTQALQAGSAKTGSLQVMNNALINGDQTIQGGLSVGTSIQAAGNASLGGLSINSLSTPAAPTVTATGGTGTAYSYAVAAFNASGMSVASQNGSPSGGGAATLSGTTAYNTITWTAVTGASGYNIYRTVDGRTTGASTGYIGTVYNDSTLSFTDNGIAAVTTETAPTTNSSGLLSVGGVMSLGQASQLSANLILYDSVNSNTVSLQTGTTSSSYSLVLPTTLATAGQCLTAGSLSGNVIPLSWSLCGGSGSSATVTLVPEFPGAVFSPASGDGTNSGYMQSDYVTGLTAAQGYQHNFYEWSTDQTTAQDYDIIVRYQLPSNFTSFVSGSWNAWVYADATGGGQAITYNIEDAAGTSCSSGSFSLTAGTWTQDTMTNPSTTSPCSFAANNVITIDFRLTAIQPSTQYVKLGEVQFGYQ